MATAKSDDESDVSSHPLAENRPGVYVQVVSPRRRKKAKRAEGATSSRPPPAKASGAANEQGKPAKKGGKASAPPAPELSEVSALPAASSTSSDAPTAASGFAVVAPKPELEPAPAPQHPASDEEDDDGRQSGERRVDFDSLRAREAASENTNHSADLLGVSIPPPPRLPSFARLDRPEREIDTDPPPPMHSASLLDAPHSLRPAPDSTPAARPSFTLLAFVAAFSAIIVTAGLVALRELAKDDAPSVVSAPSAVSGPSAKRVAPAKLDARPRVAQLAEQGQQAVPAAATSANHVQPAPVPVQQAMPVPSAPVTRATHLPMARGPRPPAVGKPLAAKKVAQQIPTAVSAPEEAEAASSEDRLPDPDEPLELPINPYR